MGIAAQRPKVQLAEPVHLMCPRQWAFRILGGMPCPKSWASRLGRHVNHLSARETCSFNPAVVAVVTVIRETSNRK